jgi:hypothetical protein
MIWEKLKEFIRNKSTRHGIFLWLTPFKVALIKKMNIPLEWAQKNNQ